MTKEIIHTEKAPVAIGPYSQAVRCGNMVFTSGLIPLNPVNGEIVSEDVAEQALQVIKNLEAVLEAAGSSLDKVIKTTVFIKDMSNFSQINEIYARFFKVNPPARSTVEVARLPRDAKIEMEVIALI